MKSTAALLTRLCLFLSGLLFFVSCKKDDSDNLPPDQGHLMQTKTFSSEVAQKWLDLQMRILRLSGATPLLPGTNPYGMNGNRNFAYLGIALYESVVPGMPGYKSLHGQLTDMPKMPATENGKAYHWPTAANATLAFLTKNFYTLASAAHKASIDSLDNALKTKYQQEADAPIFQRSEAFGKEVAQQIFDWSKTDGSLTVYPVYVPTSNPNLWSPTAPNPTGVSAPYWGANRLFVPGSLNNTASPPPPPYSTDPASDYYKMVKEVYDISLSLTPEKTATALYFRDNPGFQSGTHYQYIFNEVMHTEIPQLDFYALAQAKTGIAIAESQIGCWKIKYDLLVDRPTKYIRNVMGHTTWTSFLSMPPHPDYPSGHSQTGGAFATVMISFLGNNYPITLHTYDNLSMAPRTYNSFTAMAEDIGLSRVYGGIHYTYSCVEGNKQGMKIASNILNQLKFK